MIFLWIALNESNLKMEMYLSETFKIVLVEEIIKKKKKTRLSLQEILTIG